MADSFATRAHLEVNGKSYSYASLRKLGERFDLKRLPYSMKILLENLLRHEDGVERHAEAKSKRSRTGIRRRSRTPKSPSCRRACVLQDFTGVPCVVDLAAMRDAMQQARRRSEQDQSADSVRTGHRPFGAGRRVRHAPTRWISTCKIEFERNMERYSFLRWGQKALKNFKVVPPRTGIVHQVNLEYLARVVMTGEKRRRTGTRIPDTVFGTDSHTTMINGIGVLGWGVGGIEAEAAMLGQPSSMLIPQVVGFQLTGKLPEGATATDLVLTVTQMLRKHGVVGKFVEFFGDGLQHLPLADRATIANMAPEYGATCGIFPIDAEALNYLRLSGRERRADRAGRGLREGAGPVARRGHAARRIQRRRWNWTSADVRPSLAGPKRPQDRVLLGDVREELHREPRWPAHREPQGAQDRDVKRFGAKAAHRRRPTT